MKRVVAILLVLLLLASLDFSFVQGQEGIQVTGQEVRSEFPEGVAFQVTAETTSSETIKEIRLELRVKGSLRSSYGYLDFDPGPSVTGTYLLRASGAQFKPVGTLIEYYYIITDSAGRTLETPKDTFLYMDNRFDWLRLAEGMVEVYYYGPTKTRADLVLKASNETVTRMGGLLGVVPAQPIRIIAYNNASHMAAALPFQSQTTQRELLTQGQAWYEYGLLLMLAGDPQADGVASHEMTHMLVSELTKGAYVRLPTWLNEGLAEYGNVNPGSSKEALLSEAIASGRLLPLRHLQALPGTSRDILLLYGQARSVVTFMVDTYGADKLRDLFAAFDRGQPIDDALRTAYGFDQDGLDNAWRQSLGLPQVEPAPAPTPTLVAGATPTLPSPTAPPVTPTPGPTPKPRGGFGCAAPALP